MLRFSIHILLHFFVPAIVARVFWPSQWIRVLIIMIATMLVDLDHLLADPLIDPERCSINFHPLHTWPAILIYMGLSIYPTTRVIGVGLIIHMFLDGMDCVWMMA